MKLEKSIVNRYQFKMNFKYRVCHCGHPTYFLYDFCHLLLNSFHFKSSASTFCLISQCFLKIFFNSRILILFPFTIYLRLAFCSRLLSITNYQCGTIASSEIPFTFFTFSFFQTKMYFTTVLCAPDSYVTSCFTFFFKLCVSYLQSKTIYKQ